MATTQAALLQAKSDMLNAQLNMLRVTSAYQLLQKQHEIDQVTAEIQAAASVPDSLAPEQP